jgi:dihydropteroate synthase-like protein
MPERTKPTFFLTGHLARPRLERMLAQMGDLGFAWSVVDIGVKVAALMTEPIILRRLPRPVGACRVVLPGRCRADLGRLSAAFGVPFERGPDEISDLPAHFGRHGHAPDLSRHDMRLFAEIVEAAALDVPAIVARAEALRGSGADVIDLGCLPDTPFPHLEETVAELCRQRFVVSVDSADAGELRRGGRAGAAFLLSLSEDSIAIAEESGATPVLVPARPGDLMSLLRAADEAARRGTSVILDPVLDPIHFGFMASLGRYAELRRMRPEAELLMGTGNLTELTDADSVGATAMLLGICSELRIRNLLAVQVSSHTRRTIQEHDAARRIMFAARADQALPKGYGRSLLCLRERKPFPNSPQDIVEVAAQVTDQNFRVEVAEDGIHVYNRSGHQVTQDALAAFSLLRLDGDAPHAFYLGTELMKAEIAWRLGKRYVQDEPLDWGCAADRVTEDLTSLREAGHTLRAKA